MIKLTDIFTTLNNQQNNLIVINLNNNDLNMQISYYQDFFDVKTFNNYLLPHINKPNYASLQNIYPGVIIKITDISYDNIGYLLSSGNAVLVINDELIYQINLIKIPKRTISDSQLDPVNLLDSRDALVESINDNLALIYKRLKSANLVVKKYRKGDLTKTDVVVLYLKKYESQSYVKDINNKVQEIDTLSLNTINDLNKQLQNPSLLPLIFNTSAPDYLINSLLSGKVIVLMDNSPIGCVLPTTFSLFSTIKNEVNTPKYFSFFSKFFTILFFFLALFSLGLFIAILNFHPSILSTILIANVQLTEKGTTFPLFVESMIVLILFEFYRFVTSRSPNNYVQNIVIIFGGLFIGQNAISSGMIGSLVLMLASLAYIAGFAITNNPLLITSLSIFRFFVLIMSFTFGIVGFIFSTFLVLLYFTSQKSFGINYFDPFAPFSFKRLKAYFFPTNKGDENEQT